jgi:hypothetical protein
VCRELRALAHGAREHVHALLGVEKAAA